MKTLVVRALRAINTTQLHMSNIIKSVCPELADNATEKLNQIALTQLHFPKLNNSR